MLGGLLEVRAADFGEVDRGSAAAPAGADDGLVAVEVNLQFELVPQPLVVGRVDVRTAEQLQLLDPGV
jgi:hypothetical protein